LRYPEPHWHWKSSGFENVHECGRLDSAQQSAVGMSTGGAPAPKAAQSASKISLQGGVMPPLRKSCSSSMKSSSRL